MKHLRKKLSVKEQLQTAIEEIEGAPLEGSFENEKSDEAFSGACVLPSTVLSAAQRLCAQNESVTGRV
jgi:hypothetical protein